MLAYRSGTTCPAPLCASWPANCARGIDGRARGGGACRRFGTATAYHHYIREAIDVLAVLAPTLQQAMDEARRKASLILNGTLLPIDRIAADRPYYSGKQPP
ncbi:hypothetical protein GCM10010095_14210 [Streptomyces anthocyanicus]|nr:hypothetical protein GCM10010095_14210 [Streptomyces anthocyanicus]